MNGDGSFIDLGALSQALHALSEHPDPATVAVAVALVALLGMTVVVPMSVVCLTTAYVLPNLLGVATIMAGLTLNTLLSWSLARTVFGARLEAWLEQRGGRLGAIRDGARSNGLKWSILSRFIPAPFIAAPMVLASSGVGLGTTLLGSFIGMVPWSFAYVWVARAGREGSLAGVGKAMGALALVYIASGWLRKRALAPAALPTLAPRRDGGPVVTLYTLPGHELSNEARLELAGLRDRLDFEVSEVPLDASAEAGLRGRYEDHAPVAVFDGQKLFNFKMDENVLAVRLQEWRRRQGAL